MKTVWLLGSCGVIQGGSFHVSEEVIESEGAVQESIPEVRYLHPAPNCERPPFWRPFFLFEVAFISTVPLPGVLPVLRRRLSSEGMVGRWGGRWRRCSLLFLQCLVGSVHSALRRLGGCAVWPSIFFAWGVNDCACCAWGRQEWRTLPRLIFAVGESSIGIVMR